MDHAETASDTAISVYLTIPFDVKRPFQRDIGTPPVRNSSSADFRTRSGLLTMVLVSESGQIYRRMRFMPSCTVPQWKTVRRLLLEVRRLPDPSTGCGLIKRGTSQPSANLGAVLLGFLI